MPRLGIAVFGAGTYDHHPELDNARFTSSAELLIKTFRDRTIVPGDAPKVLNLYNKPLLPNETAIKLSEFVQRDLDDIIIYYCGHGDVTTQQGNYRVFLRRSRRHLRNSTLLDIVGLIRDIQRIAYGKRVFFVVDACYSGSAISDLQKESMDAGGAEALFTQALADAISSSGLAIFTASGSLELAFAKLDDEVTLFVGALTQCLRKGIAKHSNSERLSWWDLRDEVARTTRERLGEDAPSPRLTCLTEQFDITREPFFLNQAYAPQVVAPPTPGLMPEDLLWSKISDTTGAPALEDFLERYPRSVYGSLATQFLRKQTSGLTEAELRQYLRDHPVSRVQAFIKQRLVDLHWNRACESGDLAEFRRFAESNPGDERAQRALERIEQQERDTLFAEAQWLEVGKSSNAHGLSRFVVDFPNSPRVAEAKARIDELRSQRRRQMFWRSAATLAVTLSLAAATWLVLRPASQPPGIDYRALLDGAKDDADRLGDFLKSCRADVTCKLAADAETLLDGVNAKRRAEAEAKRQSVEAEVRRQNAEAEARRQTTEAEARRQNAEAEVRRQSAEAEARRQTAEADARRRSAEVDQKFLDSAGSDMAKLQYFVDRCAASSCGLEQEGRRRLGIERDRQAKLASERNAYQAAINDVDRLRLFVDNCRAPACTLEQEARARLDQMENAEIRSAGGYDETRLNACLQYCRTASAKAEAARRLGAVRAEEVIYGRSRGDASALASYARDCTACKLKAAAETEAEALRQRAAMRFVTYSGYDMYGGDMVGPTGLVMMRDVDSSACQSACQTTQGCIGYSYDKWIRACYLKDTMVPLAMDPRAETFIRQDQARPTASGDAKRTCPIRSLILGDVLKAIAVTGPPACDEACVATTSCVAYTHRVTDNQCTLFRATSGRQTGVQGIVSGIRTQQKC
ncbi:MAG: hypothetical protein JWO28_2013 [Hyphomicrobiales bacterium]|nr:hypothetical protein [Hyphomicrobiales bacterium]